MSAVLRAYNCFNDIETHPTKRYFLAWDGAQLAVFNDKYTADRYNEKRTLPPELCPVFFRPIPLNYAGYDLLVTLPGIGPVTAEVILAKRLELGRIRSSEQLMSIKGIGQKTAAIIEQYSTYDL
jgi:DNA uptake protein ComE-like DNA-binding protein